jgi:putative addiction module antidote
MSDEPKKPGGVRDGGETPYDGRPKPAGRTLKVRRVGNSLGVVLPKEVLAKLGVGEGDELSVSDMPSGVALSRHEAEMQEQIEAARRAMKRYRNALRELAK